MSIFNIIQQTQDNIELIDEWFKSDDYKNRLSEYLDISEQIAQISDPKFKYNRSKFTYPSIDWDTEKLSLVYELYYCGCCEPDKYFIPIMTLSDEGLIKFRQSIEEKQKAFNVSKEKEKEEKLKRLEKAKEEYSRLLTEYENHK